ncbi:HAD family hydrolase [Clostridium tagluense]|uniref:Haloacid dehalogenase n=1 Tax=Clostridium tagluense TaxID=360422 RepID=A0A401ULR0_9CLOT|nr:HAD family hydrolase [Clostridium tagluense]GCD10469.1 hypothetical protein Ctaglu_20920 [Clostridium tagluense]
MDKVIFWDFQDTLAYNDWMVSKALYKVLIKNQPNTSIGIDDFKKKSMQGFPWQNHEKEYLHLTNSNAWWKHVESIFLNCYKEFNIKEQEAIQYAKQVREEFIKVDEFILYEDTIEMLNYFKEKGYSNVILSNHIPELPSIVEGLGLSAYLVDCISSANVGYEKPNAKIYEHALEKYNNPKDVWMIGDSIVSDVKGPENAGIKCVLVRSKMVDGIRYHSKDLLGLREIIK